MKKLLICLVVALLLVTALYLTLGPQNKALLMGHLLTPSTPREFAEPGLTDWKPLGARKVSASSLANTPPVTFARALHTDIHGSDEVSAVVAPMFELDWTVETDAFVAEGPVFDRSGNVYFSPLFSADNAIIVSLNPDDGSRRWAVLSEREHAGAGTPLVIDTPGSGDQREQEQVFAVTYDRAMAFESSGHTLWDVRLNVGNEFESTSGRHCYGANYHPQTDTIVALMGNGEMRVLDRKTGQSRLRSVFSMPGDPTGKTNFSLPDGIAEIANQDMTHMYPAIGSDENRVVSVLHGAAGELQKVTNFFSIDSNSGRIWVAATLPDAEDGKADGQSSFAALYGVDLVEQGNYLKPVVASVTRVPGGTASTPTVSADGSRLYIADAFDTVYAVQANTGEKIWSFNVGDKVTGSLNVSADNNEIYANTRTAIKKIIDLGESAELAWVAKLDMYDTGRLQSNIKALGAEITANGLAFTGAAGVVAGKQKFPLRLGAGLLDRQTGKIRYFADGAEDSVSSMVSGPDGSLYVGNSPLRRVLARAYLGKHSSPQAVKGGVTRFKPKRYDLLMRDALWAASGRARNLADLPNPVEKLVAAELGQIRHLLAQCRQAAPKAIEEQSVSTSNWAKIDALLSGADQQITQDANSLMEFALLLDQARNHLQR